MFDKMAKQSKRFDGKIEKNKEKVAEINSQMEEFRDSEEFRRFAIIQEIIVKLDNKVKKENDGLQSEMNQVIKTAVQKALKKNEELMDIINTT